MPKLFVPVALVMAIAAGGAASAATKPAPAAPAASAKHADCAKRWSAEKKHTQTRKAFLAACEKA
jgi:hypothetical protein